jgi:hypothetical protein
MHQEKPQNDCENESSATTAKNVSLATSRKAASTLLTFSLRLRASSSEPSASVVSSICARGDKYEAQISYA